MPDEIKQKPKKIIVRFEDKNTKPIKFETVDDLLEAFTSNEIEGQPIITNIDFSGKTFDRGLQMGERGHIINEGKMHGTFIRCNFKNTTFKGKIRADITQCNFDNAKFMKDTGLKARSIKDSSFKKTVFTDTIIDFDEATNCNFEDLEFTHNTFYNEIGFRPANTTDTVSKVTGGTFSIKKMTKHHSSSVGWNMSFENVDFQNKSLPKNVKFVRDSSIMNQKNMTPEDQKRFTDIIKKIDAKNNFKDAESTVKDNADQITKQKPLSPEDQLKIIKGFKSGRQ